MKADSTKKTVPERREVLDDVRQIVAEYLTLPLREVQENHALIADLGCDSLDIVEITMEVEEHFSLTVPEDQEQDIRTVGDIADGVLHLLGAEPRRRSSRSSRTAHAPREE